MDSGFPVVFGDYSEISVEIGPRDAKLSSLLARRKNFYLQQIDPSYGTLEDTQQRAGKKTSSLQG